MRIIDIACVVLGNIGVIVLLIERQRNNKIVSKKMKNLFSIYTLGLCVYLFIFCYWCVISGSEMREMIMTSSEVSFAIGFAKACIFGAEDVAPFVARISILIGIFKSLLLAIDFCLKDEVKNLQKK